MLETSTELYRLFTRIASTVRDVLERSQVVRLLHKIGDLATECHIPHRAYQGHERSFTGAVGTDQQGQRRQGYSLLVAKATKVLNCNAVHEATPIS